MLVPVVEGFTENGPDRFVIHIGVRATTSRTKLVGVSASALRGEVVKLLFRLGGEVYLHAFFLRLLSDAKLRQTPLEGTMSQNVTKNNVPKNDFVPPATVYPARKHPRHAAPFSEHSENSAVRASAPGNSLFSPSTF